MANCSRRSSILGYVAPMLKLLLRPWGLMPLDDAYGIYDSDDLQLHD
jgi:hypothetical protein